MAFARVNAQERFTLTCSVADEKAVTIYHNEPLVISVGLSNKAIFKDWQWNMAADSELQKLDAYFKTGNISEEAYKKEKERIQQGKKLLKANTIGSDTQPWYDQFTFHILQNDSIQIGNWPINRLGKTPFEAVAVLNEQAFYAVDFHMPPEAVSLIKPGNYSVKALLDGVWSNEIKITVLPENIPQAVSLSTEMQLRLGQYYLLAGQADKVFNYATAVLQRNPLHLEALILRGEGYILKEDYKLALTDFEKALQQHNKKFPTLYEPPEYLLGTIEWLKDKQ
jgi:tetratricopeptide (TPR) repeat protein